MGRSKRPPRRPRFRCKDCDITFEKYESLECHRNIYCAKREKVPPTSTITNQMLMNSPQSSVQMQVNDASLQNSLIRTYQSQNAVNFAMASKRSALQESMKAALEARNAITLQKEAEQQQKRAFQQYDYAVNNKRTLPRDASPRLRERVDHAVAHFSAIAQAALLNAKQASETAQQALQRQNSAIQAAALATAQEQTAFIVAVSALKKQASVSLQHVGLPSGITLSSAALKPFPNSSETSLLGVDIHKNKNFVTSTPAIEDISDEDCHIEAMDLSTTTLADSKDAVKPLPQCSQQGLVGVPESISKNERILASTPAIEDISDEDCQVDVMDLSITSSSASTSDSSQKNMSESSQLNFSSTTSDDSTASTALVNPERSSDSYLENSDTMDAYLNSTPDS